MKKLLSMALAACLFVPSTAMAWEEGSHNEVYVNYEFAGVMIPFLLKDAGTACLYTTAWYSPTWAYSEQCDFFERKTKVHLSCLANRYFNFPTTLTSGEYCRGFDDWGIPVKWEYINAGEHYDGWAGACKRFGSPVFDTCEAWVY